MRTETFRVFGLFCWDNPVSLALASPGCWPARNRSEADCGTQINLVLVATDIHISGYSTRSTVMRALNYLRRYTTVKGYPFCLSIEKIISLNAHESLPSGHCFSSASPHPAKLHANFKPGQPNPSASSATISPRNRSYDRQDGSHQFQVRLPAVKTGTFHMILAGSILLRPATPFFLSFSSCLSLCSSSASLTTMIHWPL